MPSDGSETAFNELCCIADDEDDAWRFAVDAAFISVTWPDPRRRGLVSSSCVPPPNVGAIEGGAAAASVRCKPTSCEDSSKKLKTHYTARTETQCVNKNENARVLVNRIRYRAMRARERK